MTGCLIHNADIEFPGYLSVSQQLKFSDIPNGGQGIFSIPPEGLAQILAFCALVELAWWPANKYDGDYGCGFFGATFDAEKKTEKLNAELANGRLAMLGIFGNMVAEAQTGQTFGEQMAAGNMSLFFVNAKLLFNTKLNEQLNAKFEVNLRRKLNEELSVEKLEEMLTQIMNEKFNDEKINEILSQMLSDMLNQKLNEELNQDLNERVERRFKETAWFEEKEGRYLGDLDKMLDKKLNEKFKDKKFNEIMDDVLNDNLKEPLQGWSWNQNVKEVLSKILTKKFNEKLTDKLNNKLVEKLDEKLKDLVDEVVVK